MDYCDHENNLLQCSERYEHLKNQYFAFSNHSRNFIVTKFY